MEKNILYYGDNLKILREHIENESVDLIYLDPPFKSDQDYNVLFAEQNGSRSAAQIQAFEDTWHWDQKAASSFYEVVETGPDKASQAMQAFKLLLGETDMLAYLAMMAPRLVELHKALKPTGSIYLHCDPAASHYLKILMDAMFGAQNFRNEIVWRRTASHNQSKRYGPIHDVLLFYTRTNHYNFNVFFKPYAKGHVESYFRKKDDRGRYWTNALTGAGIRHGDSGKSWRGFDPTTRGRHWAIPGELVRELGIDEGLPLLEKLDALYDMGCIDIPQSGEAMPTFRQYLHTSKGLPVQDIWAYQPYTSGVLYGTDEAIDQDVRWIPRQGSQERLGFQTQKPLGLLKRIILASSAEGEVVLDPFCGCGTTVVAAHELKRHWIGIDITYLSVALMKRRLSDAFGVKVEGEYEVKGVPTCLSDARALAQQDPFQFQLWSLDLVNARTDGQKKGADRGIDGRVYFHDEPAGGLTKQIIFSVKAGHTNPSHVRDLRGTIEREKAEIGVFICLQKPTKEMRKEAASAGFYESPWRKGKPYSKLQILTIADLLRGKQIDCPPLRQVDVTFKKASKVKSTVTQKHLAEEVERNRASQ